MAGFDDVKDKSLLSSKGSELLKARQERIQNKSVQEVRILEKMAQDLAEIDKLSANLDIEFDKKLTEITRLSHRVEEMKKAVAQAEKGRSHGAEKTFKQAATTMTSSSSTLSDISAASRSSTNLGPALTMGQNQTTASLEDYIASRKSLLAKQNDRIRETSTNVEGQEGQFSSQVAVREKLVSQIGQAQAAMTAQKRLGIDTSSSYYNAVETTQKVRADVERTQIQSGVKEGAFGGRKQVEEQLDAVAKRLIATFEQLDTAVKSGSKEAGELAKQFDSVEKDYKKQKDILSEMNRAGGGGQSGMQVAGGIISNLGTIGMGVAQGARHIGVTSELTQGQNRIGMANMANQRFSDAYGATQGDMGALRRVLSDQYSEQVQRGMLLHGREDAAKLGETAALGAKAVGTGIDAATSGGGVVEGVKGFFMGGPAGASAAMVTEGLAKATPDALAFTQSATDYAKQNTQIQTFLAAQQQSKQLADAVAQVSDFSSQAAFDQQRGLTYATRGLGVGSSPNADYYSETSFKGNRQLGTETSGILPIKERPPLADAPGQMPFVDKKTGEPVKLQPFNEDQSARAAQYIEERSRGQQTLTTGEKVKRFFGFGPSEEELRFRGAAAISKDMKKEEAHADHGDEHGAPAAPSPISKGIMHPTGGVGRISSGFGHRHHPVTGEKGSFHNGVDIAAPAGSPLYAVGGGKVLESGYNSTSGNFVRMEHEGKQFGYAHMREPSKLKAGEEVQRGQVLGQVGSTGRSTGPHLHFTAKDEQGRAFDPSSMLGRIAPSPREMKNAVEAPHSTTEALTSTNIKGGGDRQNLQALLSDPKVIAEIAEKSGLSGKDVNRLTGMGVAGLGKEMARDGGQGGVRDITRAGELSRIGYMQSPDQYMQARTQMTGVGGGAEDFEEILKNAVANGMDASKNIMEMVAATSQLASRSSGAGIAAFGGAAEGLGRGIDVLRGTGVSENMATAAAARAAGVAEDVSGSKDLDIANVIETARLRKDFGKASLQQLESMRTASPAELSQLEKLYKGGKTAQAEEMTIKMGLHGVVNNAADVSKIQKASREQVIRRATGFGIDREKEEAIINKDEKDLTKAERSFMAGMTRSNLGRDVSADALRGYVDHRGSARKGELARDPGGGVAGGEDAIRAGSTADAKVYEEGVKNITNAMGGLEAIGSTMMKVAEAIKPDEFAKSVKDAAKDFAAPATALGKDVQKLNNSIEDLIKAISKVPGGSAIDLKGQVNRNQTRD